MEIKTRGNTNYFLSVLQIYGAEQQQRISMQMNISNLEEAHQMREREI